MHSTEEGTTRRMGAERAGVTSVAVISIGLAVAGLCALGVAPASLGGQEEPSVSWYGYMKMDASWDEGLVNSGNFARWVVSSDVAPEHGHFNMTARQSRIGLRASSSAGAASLTGRWEADFYGGGAENKNSLQVRHAYLELAWGSGWSLLAGQTSDVISPLAPNTLNYTVAWWAGNTGYRRPQLRLTRKVDVGGGRTLEVVGAAARTIGDDFVDAEPGDSGSDSGYPTFQGRIGMTWPAWGSSIRFGAFVHRGEENLHRVLGGEETKLTSSGWGGYLTLPLSSVTLSGEAWTGSNLDDYLGGIAQGIRVDQTVATSVTSTGGWAELVWRMGRTRVQAGASLDDPDNTDLAVGYRARNLAAWGTLARDLGGGLTGGVEVSRWATRYVGRTEGTSWRVQGSLIYAF